MSTDIGRVGVSTIESGRRRPIDSRSGDGASRGRVRAESGEKTLTPERPVVDNAKSSPQETSTARSGVLAVELP